MKLNLPQLKKFLLLSVFLTFLGFGNVVNGQSTGWLSPATTKAENSVGNQDNVFASDNLRATWNDSDDWADYGDFNINIPVGSVIYGIEVRAEGYRSASDDRNMDVLLSFDNGSNYISSQQLPINVYSSGTENYFSAGSNVDTWGHSWSLTELNNTNFRVRLDATGGGGTLLMDHLQINVHYGPPTSPYIITTPGTSTFTVPSCVTSITVEAWGGGGKGSTGTSDGEYAGGGGGAYARSVLTVSPGQIYDIFVGTGSTTTSAGESSRFRLQPTGTDLVRAVGGQSVANNNNTGTLGGLASASLGDVTFNGGRGANGSSNNYGGGGGSSGGTSSNGTYTASVQNRLGGTVAGGGSGGDGSTTDDASGNTGNGPGGGGSGVRRNNGNVIGGSGANGQVKITWTVGSAPTITGTTPNSRCGTGTVVLGATASAGTINWYIAATGGTSIGTGTSFTTPSISTTTTYYVDATNGSCTSATRTAIIATVNATPTITGTTPNSRCGTGIVVLEATASAGTINWYAAVTGGSSLGTGPSFTTPSISTTTTYYVDATNGSCTTATRTAIIATVNATPTITGTTPNSRCGTGTVVLGATASVGTINWYIAATGGTSIGTGTSFTTPSISTTTTYYVDATNGGCTSATRTAVIASVNPLLPASVSISANPSLIVCDGTSVTYTATPINGGSSPAYQWKVNGTNVGINNPTYTYVPLNGDIISAVLTSSDACSSGLLTQPILNFSWNDNTKPITDSDYGINAISGVGQYLAGSLAPIVAPKTDINLTFDGTANEFNSEGIDYSLSYSRNEGDSELFTRGNSLIITGGSNFSVSYRVSDGAGSFTTVTSGNFPIAIDGFHVYRFRYDPYDGYGRLYVDGSQVWISPAATIGKPMYWTGAGNVVVGKVTDASGNLLPTFDNLLMSAVYVKSAAAQVAMTVNAAPATPGVITGTVTQFPNLTGQTYSIAAVPNATTYNWIVPTGWSIISGAGTTAITVTTGNVGNNGDITVSAENSCGTSAESTLAVTVIASKIDFDGTDDYIDFGDNHDLTGNFTLEAWVLQTIGTTGTHTIISKGDARTSGSNLRGFNLFLNNSVPNLTWYNNSGGVLLNIASPNLITNGIWHHIAATYDGTIAKLYVDGIDVIPAGVSFSSIATGTQPFLVGAMYDSNTTTVPKNNFDGYIDEVRVWDVALSKRQIREMMNQRIIQNGTAVKGRTIPLDITEGLLWSNLKGYYPMSDGYTANDQSSNAIKINGSPKNITTNQPNTAPLPYESILGGDWDDATTWKNSTVQYLPYSVGIDGSTKIDWNIVETNHNIFTTRDITVFGLKNNVNKLSVNASNSLEVLYYLLINEKIDLIGESQLIQSKESTFDANSLGVIEIDQQGEGNRYRYNYWSMPVYTDTDGIMGKHTTIFASLRNGTIPSSPGIITFNNSGYDGATSPFTLSTYWMYKYANSGGGYSAWNQIRSTGKVYAGQGFTMKGPGAPGSSAQNYVFVGKPNNGTIELTVAKNNDYLVGNPYPSALDAYQFLDDNSPTGTASITGTIYFWEHYGGNTHNLAGYQAGYATLSKSGGVQASSFPGLGGGISAKGAPKQFIPVGQAFFVVGEAVDGGQIQFNNGQRGFKRESLGETLFMKSNNTKSKNNSIEAEDLRPKFRIGFDAPKISHRQLLLTIDEKATLAVDWGYDAEIYEVFVDDMYWMLNNKKYVIQATNEVGLNSEVPLGIQLSKTGVVSVKIDALENVDNDISVYLKDKLTGESFNMRDKPVQLNLTAGKYTDRFVIVFKMQKLVAEDVKTEILIPDLAQPIIEGIHAYMDNANGELQIKNNSTEEILSVVLINSLGQTIKTWNSNFNIRTISLPISAATGIYLVQINTKTGKSVKKINVE